MSIKTMSAAAVAGAALAAASLAAAPEAAAAAAITDLSCHSANSTVSCDVAALTTGVVGIFWYVDGVQVPDRGQHMIARCRAFSTVNVRVRVVDATVPAGSSRTLRCVPPAVM